MCAFSLTAAQDNKRPKECLISPARHATTKTPCSLARHTSAPNPSNTALDKRRSRVKRRGRGGKEAPRLLGLGLLRWRVGLGFGLAAGWCLLAGWLGFGGGPEGLVES
jgi:hypothetical protein